jgi:hypothetical protein
VAQRIFAIHKNISALGVAGLALAKNLLLGFGISSETGGKCAIESHVSSNETRLDDC